MYGAFLGGLILGTVEAFANGLGGSGYQDAVAFLLLIVLLMVRPSGLLGGTGRARCQVIGKQQYLDGSHCPFFLPWSLRSRQCHQMRTS